MTRLEPELWVERPGKALEFYCDAFGATVLHQVGEGDDIVAQVAIGDAVFWVSCADSNLAPRNSHRPVRNMARWSDASSTPFGHEREIGKPTRPWPPDEN